MIFLQVDQSTREIKAHGAIMTAPWPGHDLVTVDDSLRPQLEQIGSKVLNANGTVTVTPFPVQLRYASALNIVPRRVRTSNTVATEILRETVPPSTEWTAAVTMRAITDDIQNLRIIRAEFTVARGTAGGAVFAPARVGGANVEIKFDRVIGAGASVAIPQVILSGNDVTVVVTGLAATNINWLLTGSYETFAPLGVA